MTHAPNTSPESQPARGGDAPPHRYNAALAQQIESAWQEHWRTHATFHTPNPGEPGFDASRAKKYILDMFPYPSGVGLHVGHPLGYIATDIYARYLRMAGFNVLHTMGFDSFGLPAEQFALQTGAHPRISTEANIATMRSQLTRLGLGHDPHRSVSTTDPEFYKWTQWVFLQIYGSWYDERVQKARPIDALRQEFESGARLGADGRGWSTLTAAEQRAEIDKHRLAFLSEVPVNWCPMLGTVLANEEVTADNRSERGNFPVYKRPLRQWMMRITAYADRLLEDLDKVDWPEPIRMMQRNWIGRSEGAVVGFETVGGQPLRGGSSFASPNADTNICANTIRMAAAYLSAGETLNPRNFLPKDPYPTGTWGGVASLVRSRRFLPHLNLPGATYFVTWKTAVPVLSESERTTVLNAMLHFEGVRYQAYAAVVMSNHVHWIVRPYEGFSLDDIVKSVKHFTATEINRARGVKGHLWDSERFDHIVRDAAAFTEFTQYVIENPVDAGVVTKAEDYPWTALHHDVLGARETSAAAERLATQEARIEVFTTRPDTLFGATYVVLSPEHPLVDSLTPEAWPEGTNPRWKGTTHHASPGVQPREAVAAYRVFAKTRTEDQRTAAKDKTGVFTGAFAVNPASGKPIPIFIADYVLMNYGTGAIMAVPAQDQRDWDFAKTFDLPIVRTVQPPAGFKDDNAYTGDGPAINSAFLDGLGVADAKQAMIGWLEAKGLGRGTTTYKLRDWLFSRQRYWGEPFPIVYDAEGVAHPLPQSMLPLLLPPLDNFQPESSEDPNAPVRTPLNRAKEWVSVTLDLGDGPKPYTRETNTMPNWAGSCWYYLRYLDPDNAAVMIDSRVERYWMAGQTATSAREAPGAWVTGASRAGELAGETNDAASAARPPAAIDPDHFGGVDLYVGGVEHAVLHLLYARFWHKVLFDLGHVSTPEPFQRLFNQGYIQAFFFEDARGTRVDAFSVTLPDGTLAMEHQDKPGPFAYKGEPVTRQYGKMGKSLKNAISPDEMFAEFGCDTLRIYEMAMGPLEASKPWNTRDITGSYRFLQKVWRNLIDENTGLSRCVETPADRGTLRVLHKAIKGVRRDMECLGLNTAVSKLIEVNNHIGSLDAPPVSVAAPLILMLAPLAPHIAEELWHRVMRLPRDADAARGSILLHPFPIADETLAADDEVEIPVSIMGKLRSKVMVPAGSDAQAIEAAARADPRVQELMEGKPIKKVIVVPGRMINFVLG